MFCSLGVCHQLSIEVGNESAILTHFFISLLFSYAIILLPFRFAHPLSEC